MDESLLKKVDDFNEFLFVNELDEQLFSLLSKDKVFNIGKSANGHSILCARIGNGKKNALIFGFPHPNEPIGSLTCISLIKILLANKKLQEKFTWYIVPCADPDGAELNKGWLKGKFSIKKYAYNFYRSKASIQTDWSFPIEYKGYKFDNSPPNVLAIKKLIEDIKPDLVYPLHNSGFSGAYFFITKAMPEKYYDEIIKLCKCLSIPLDLGEPEAQFIKELKKPIYLDYSFEDVYNYYKSLDKDPKEILVSGTSSIGFTKKLNPDVFGLIGEIPYIYDLKITDNSATNRTRRDNLSEELKINTEILDFVESVINHKGINKNSIFYDLLKYNIENDRKYIEADKINLKKEEYKKIATVAEEFSTLVITRFYSSLTLGELRRLLLESKRNEEINKLIKNVENKIDELISFVDKQSDYKVLPIKNLVQLQLGCLLISLDYL